MFERKNIILNGVENKSQKAVLTIENKGTKIDGTLRLYNFGLEPKGILSLGVYQNEKVIKAGLTQSSNMVYTFSFNDEKLLDKYSCAVINFVEGEAKPILYGNSEGYSDQDEVFSEVIDALSFTKNVDEVKNALDDYGIDFDDQLKDEIDKEIDYTLAKEGEKCFSENCNDCQSCKYKKYYLSNVNENIDEIEVEKEKTFYSEIKSHIEDLFKSNPSEDYLKELIPNSKWTKVKVDENGNYYVLGLIYENEELKYICYGVPGVYQPNCPRELSGYPVWFPLEESKPEGFGYWLSYQDAENGESVKATII